VHPASELCKRYKLATNIAEEPKSSEFTQDYLNRVQNFKCFCVNRGRCAGGRCQRDSDDWRRSCRRASAPMGPGTGARAAAPQALAIRDAIVCRCATLSIIPIVRVQGCYFRHTVARTRVRLTTGPLRAVFRWSGMPWAAVNAFS